jgi:hypothetical protein
MVNQPGFDAINRLLQGQLGQTQNQQNAYVGQAANMFGQMGDLSGNYQNMIAAMLGNNGQGGLVGALNAAGQGYDPNAGFDAFYQQQPQLQQLAENMTNRALTQQGDTARSLAQRTAQQALAGVSGDLASAGLLGSGAANAAMLEAALTPTLNTENQLAATRAGYLGGLNQMLAGQGMQQAQAAYNQQQDQIIRSILGQMQGVESGAGMLGNQIGALGSAGQGYAGLGQLYGSQNASLLGNLAQLNQAEYWQPQYQKNRDWVDYLGLGAQLLGGIGGFATGIPGIIGGVGAIANLLGNRGNSPASATPAAYNVAGPNYLPSRQPMTIQ